MNPGLSNIIELVRLGNIEGAKQAYRSISVGQLKDAQIDEAIKSMQETYKPKQRKPYVRRKHPNRGKQIIT